MNHEDRNNVLASLYELYKGQSLCDVTLKGSDQGEIKCQKLILAASSPFFHAMFVGPTGHAMREKDSQIIDLPGISAPVLQQVIAAVYQEDCLDLITEDNVEPLLSGSSYLSISKVRNAVCAYLSRHLSLETVVQTIALASQYDCTHLFDEAMHYCQGHFRELLLSSYRSTLGGLTCNLIYELLNSDALEITQERDVITAAVTWVIAEPATRIEHLALLLKTLRMSVAISTCEEAAREAVINTDIDLQTQEREYVVNAVLEAIEQLETERRVGGITSTTVKLGPRQGTPTQLMALGGWEEGWRELNTVELYDPREDQWRPGPSMPASCAPTCAGTSGLSAYVVIGTSLRPSVLAYDRRERSWRTASAPPLIPRMNAAVAGTPHSVYLVGGFKDTGSSKTRGTLNDVERYDTSTNQWRRIASMEAARKCLGAVALDGTIYAFGGQNRSSPSMASAEVYDPGLDRWRMLQGELQQDRKYLTAACAPGQGLVFAVGGMTATRQRLHSVEALDPREGRWRQLPPMSVARSSCGACVLDGELFVVGGSVDGGAESAGVAHAGVESFSLVAGKWREVAPMSTKRSALAVTAV